MTAARLTALIVAGMVSGFAAVYWLLPSPLPSGTSRAPSYAIYESTNLPGADLVSAPIPSGSPSECGRRCTRTGGCTGFVVSRAGYFDRSEPACWLKTGSIKGGTPNSCCVLGVRTP